MNIESSALVNSFEMEVLPREILCIIFSYLDKQSVENATGTCKLWFELIRNDKSLSGDICLEKLDLQELSQKILIGEWNWARWPALKTIKFGGLSAKVDFFYKSSRRITTLTTFLPSKLIKKTKICSGMNCQIYMKKNNLNQKKLGSHVLKPKKECWF